MAQGRRGGSRPLLGGQGVGKTRKSRSLGGGRTQHVGCLWVHVESDGEWRELRNENEEHEFGSLLGK